ncbi:hypothetical protein TNCV_3710951 [Trichonephila clavipes]|uniref:Uncharacterized protein n=1 Tax=Trichonephila clavipes TaxID=2585209 RepID=A0A8X6R765_TRICX|nr:hypothetical protein TNCV_3710951 [Trichonephila clavipes]
MVKTDDQIKQVPIVEKPLEIDQSETKLGKGQNQALKDLFNSFKGLFSNPPGLTYVLYHEIDTEEQGPVVSKLYREQLVQEQREDPELGHIYRYLEIPDDGSVNPEGKRGVLATGCNDWKNSFALASQHERSDVHMTNVLTFLLRKGANTVQNAVQSQYDKEVKYCEFTDVLSKRDLQEILKEVKLAHYSIDPTPDASDTDQLAVVLRYVSIKKACADEHLVRGLSLYEYEFQVWKKQPSTCLKNL